MDYGHESDCDCGRRLDPIIAAANEREGRAVALAEARFDCRRGPGWSSSEPPCGACVTCLTRSLAAVESLHRDEVERAEEAERRAYRLSADLDSKGRSMQDALALRDEARAERDRLAAALHRLEETAPDPRGVLRLALEDNSDPPSMIRSANRDYEAALAEARAALPGHADEHGSNEEGA